MKSIYDTSTCSNCSQKIAKGVEIEKNKENKWVHSVCPGPTVAQVEQVQNVGLNSKGVDVPQTQEVLHPDDETDIYKNCIEGCVRAAEFFKSIDYPKELWGLTQIWNTERIKKK